MHVLWYHYQCWLLIPYIHLCIGRTLVVLVTYFNLMGPLIALCMWIAHMVEDAWVMFILKHNRTRDQIAQANIHTQLHMNNVWSEMVILTPCLPFRIFTPWFIQCMWDISTLTFPQTIWVYSNLIHFSQSNKHYLMTTSNLMLYLQYSHFVSSKTISILLPLIVIVKYYISKWHGFTHFQIIIQIYPFCPFYPMLVPPPFYKHMLHHCDISLLLNISTKNWT